MNPKVIISYDGTVNDDDALALGRLFARTGAEIALAYVRHTDDPEHGAEVPEAQRADELLARGASTIGVAEAPRHVVQHRSTGEGLRELAEREQADIVVFGSDYRTATGSVRPGTSAQRLLAGGPVAVAIAPAGLRDRGELAIEHVALLADGTDEGADRTAHELAEAFGASVLPAPDPTAELLVVGSRDSAAAGRVGLSARSEYVIETATTPVLVLPRGGTLRPVKPAELAAV